MTPATLLGSLLAYSEGWTMHGASGWWAPMMLGMALFWGAIFLGLFWLVRESAGRCSRTAGETAQAILDRRFAAGDLSPEEYDRRREALAPHEASRR